MQKTIPLKKKWRFNMDKMRGMERSQRQRTVFSRIDYISNITKKSDITK